MFVLGTAGHIDHGKSSLIRAMTGIDPDRLPEEQERGMTIDLGFAWVQLPGGDEIGIVDVPGHERFVRNMVAGAGGVNAAVLVVAADDGWMPQTQEHFDILNLLGIEYGLVAITKTDLVEKDWLDLVIADVTAKVRGSFLEGGPIVPVSSETGEGVPDVLAAIDAISQKIRQIEDIGKTRLFVDRAFILTGIGVVVTGTGRGGGFSADTDVYHFPSGDKIKVRSLQSHEKKVEAVVPGSRVAINLSGVSREDIRRGHVITGFEYKAQPRYFAVSISNLPSSTLTLKEGRKILFILGTTETEAIIRPFPEAGIKPGETALALIKTDEPVAAFIHDRFIIRLPTPQVTIGGGQVLDLLDSYSRRKALPSMIDYLSQRTGGTIRDCVITEVGKSMLRPAAGLLMYANVPKEKIDEAIANLIETGEIIRHEDTLMVAGPVAEMTEAIKAKLEKIHASKSYLKGLTIDELSRLLKVKDQDKFLLVLKFLEASSQIGRTQQFYHLPDFTPVLDDRMKTEADRIMSNVVSAGHNYLTLDEIEKRFPGSRQTVNFLRDGGRMKMIGSQFVMTGDIWKEIISFTEKILNSEGKLTVAQFRDSFGSSRKFALPVLEFLDQLGITRREGDYRIKGARFDERHLL